MTREEAITIIDNLHLIGCGRNQHEDDLKINIALDMAIEALSNCTTEKPNDIVDSKNDAVAEPTDLISRADVLDIITFKRKLANIDGRILLDETVDRINALPSAEQVTSKLKNPCDSLLTEESNGSKEQKSKLEHDREWIIGCIKHDGFIKTDRFDKANQIILEALSAEQKEEELAKDIARRMATIIENEQDMRVILKNASAEPTELLDDGTLKVKTDNGADVKRVLVWGDDGCGGLYYADDRPSGEWVEKEVMVDEDKNITEWQSAKCSVCGKYHTTPYMYYFDSFNYCPNCGADMRGEKRVND